MISLSLSPPPAPPPPPPPPPPPLSHSLALVDPLTTGAAARYLNHDERVLAVKAKAPPTAMFVLCVFTQGTAILEIVNSVKQNVSSFLKIQNHKKKFLGKLWTPFLNSCP